MLKPDPAGGKSDAVPETKAARLAWWHSPVSPAVMLVVAIVLGEWLLPSIWSDPDARRWGRIGLHLLALCAVLHWLWARRAVALVPDVFAKVDPDAAQVQSLLVTERLRLALQAGRLGQFEIDGEAGHVVRWTAGLAQLIGASASRAADGQLPLAQALAHVHRDDAPQVAAAVSATLATGQPFRMAYRLFGQDGQLRWVRATGARLPAQPGANLQLVGLLQDITEERQQAHRLQEGAAWRQMLVEQSRDGAVVVGLDGAVLQCNDAMARMLGYTVEHLCGLRLWQLGVGHTSDSVQQALRDTEAANLLREFNLVRRDGALIRVEVSACRGLLEDQPVWFALCRDITLRKRTEWTLRENEARFRATFENSAVGMAENRISGEWLRVNRRLCEITGYARDALMAQDFWTLTHPDDRAEDRAQTLRLLRRETDTCQVEKRYVRADGRTVWVARTTSLVRGDDGRAQHFVTVVEDISQRRLAQQALWSSERHHRTVIDALSEGVLVFHGDGRLRQANAAAQAMLSMRLAELQRPMAEWGLCGLDGKPAPPEALPLALMRDGPQGCQGAVMGLKQPERQVWLRISCAPMDTAGSEAPADVVMSLVDITEQQHTAQQLRLLSMAVAQSPSAIIIMDDQGRIEYVNEAYTRMTGRTAADVQGANRRMDEWTKADATQSADLMKTVRKGEVWRGDMVSVRKDGERYHESVVVVPMRQPNGPTTHYLAILEDISDRKRIAAELARHRDHLEAEVAVRTRAMHAAMLAREDSERFLRSVADNLPDMVAYWDKQRVCCFANKAYADWAGRGRHSVLGHSRRELLGDPDLDPTEPTFARALEGHRQDFEHLVVHPAGIRRHVWIHYIPDVQFGQVAGVFVLVTDVSEIKFAENRLQSLNEQLVQARDRAEQASRAKSAFLANISHEIRTPMNAIIGLTHLMQRDLSDPLALARLDKVTQAAHHLLAVINDVLDLSKIESGKLSLQDADFKLKAVLSRVNTLVADQARAKGLDLQMTLDNGLPERVRGDATRISQALLNLLSNAVKFTDHGQIVLRCERVAPPAGSGVSEGAPLTEGQPLWLRFAVDDTGVGVEAAKLSSLFEAFEQADSSNTRRHGGSGLGLAITRRLAQMMGGDVGASSVPGQGSCFWFTVQLADAGPEPATETNDASTPQRQGGSHHHEQQLRDRYPGARVLLVEDNPVNQEVAMELLRDVGLRPDCAADGAQAVALARVNEYRAILMDMQMPRLDGLAATRQIRAMPMHARTPILAMTANAFGDDRQACLDAGMDDHLAKPVDPEKMYAMLARWLDSAAPAQPSERPMALKGHPTPASAVDQPSLALGDIPGLTMTRALLYLPGRDAVFARVLQQFVDGHNQGLPGMDQALAQRDWPQVMHLLHGLRGTCGAIGAVALMAQAQALELRLAQAAAGDDLPELVRQTAAVTEGLRELVARVAQRLTQPAAEPMPTSTSTSGQAVPEAAPLQ